MNDVTCFFFGGQKNANQHTFHASMTPLRHATMSNTRHATMSSRCLLEVWPARNC